MAAFLVVPLYFDKHRHVATGIGSMGPGAGLLVMSPVAQVLVEHLGWRKALIALACMNLTSSFLGLVISRKNIPGEDDSPHTEEEANKKL